MSSTRHTHGIRARWICPIDRPPIENGLVAIADGRIRFVGRAGEFATDSLDDLGDVILLPGLINAHTHLELGWCRGLISPRPLWDWFDELLRLNLAPGAEEKRRQSVADGVAESLAAGVTCVADISRTGMSAGMLRASPIRSISFVELISGARSLPNSAATLDERLGEVLPSANDLHAVGISPHTPFSVTEDDLAACSELAAQHCLPVTLHLLETPDERDWYAVGSGRVADYLIRFGIGHAGAQPPGDPIKLLTRTRLLDRAPLLAHVNYVTDDEIACLAAADASVVWCPRTHAYFSHAPHRWRDMLRAGVNVCFGTDSLASNPSLSILEELRHAARLAPDCPASELLECATLRAAGALGLAARIGSLTNDKDGDLIAVPWSQSGDTDPLRNAIEGGKPVEKVWIRGNEVYSSPDR